MSKSTMISKSSALATKANQDILCGTLPPSPQSGVGCEPSFIGLHPGLINSHSGLHEVYPCCNSTGSHNRQPFGNIGSASSHVSQNIAPTSPQLPHCKVKSKQYSKLPAGSHISVMVIQTVVVVIELVAKSTSSAGSNPTLTISCTFEQGT